MASITVLSKSCYLHHNLRKISPIINSLKLFSKKYSSDIKKADSNHYDIIIAGGGMVGTSFVLALAKDTRLSLKRVLLLEGGPPSKETLPESFSNRVSSISCRSSKFLTKLGAWEKLSRFQPVNHMQVWDACSDSLITFNDNFDDIAFIVENDAILHSVTSCLTPFTDSDRIKVLNNSKVNKIQLVDHEKNVNIVELASGDTYSCDLLIGADGANSKIRRQMDVQYINWSYDQLGIVATLELSEEQSNNTAWQRFLPTGPVAILPLSDRYSSLVWSTTPELAKQLLALEPQEFVQRLNQALISEYSRNKIIDNLRSTVNIALRNTLGNDGCALQIPPQIKDVLPESRAAFPLGFGHSVNYIKPGVVLIGDAAHRVHPLAGQGVNLGFGDVETLVDILGDAVHRGEDTNALELLQEYETTRQRENIPTMLAIEGLHRLYTTEATPVVLLRSLGLQITHTLTPLKKAMIQHASGTA